MITFGSRQNLIQISGNELIIIFVTIMHHYCSQSIQVMWKKRKRKDRAEE